LAFKQIVDILACGGISGKYVLALYFQCMIETGLLTLHDLAK
jgi:hypothetical protein